MSEYGFLSIDEVQRALSEGASPHVVLNVKHEASEVADGAAPVRPDEEQQTTLSPGSVQLPPGTEDRYPPDLIERMNQPGGRPAA